MIDDDEDEVEKVDRKNLSAVPSWLMVGFVIGVVTMWLFRSPPPEPQPEPAPPAVAEVAAPEANETTPPARSSVALAEALFDTHRDWVFWNEDKTQIALWNSEAMAFSDHFEVIRTLEGDYFRSISEFTRLPLPGYGPPSSPVLFTETLEQRYKREISLNPDALPKTKKPAPIELNSLPPPPSG
jgi:hypothetical protein